jgi:phage protein D
MADRVELFKPFLYVEINNRDVSAYITPYLLSFRYIDNDGLDKDESDDVEIEVEDSIGFFRKNPPARGSSLKVRFGYEEAVRDAGVFFIDSYTFRYSQSGATFTIKALAKDVKASFRTLKTTAFENTSLKKIAEDIAKRNGYKLYFEGSDITFQRIDQYKQRDLEFLSQLCKRYGYTCKTADGKIVIQGIESILNRNVMFVLTPEWVIDLGIEVSSLNAGTVDVVYLDPQKKEATADKKKANVEASQDKQVERVRVENKAQAERISNAQKALNEMREFKGRLTCVGIPSIYASGSIELKGFDNFDGVYYVAQVEHEIRRDGYTTRIEFLKKPGESKSKGGRKK